MVDQVVERFCPECGYNLRGLGGGRCPECGLEVSGEYVSPVPWEHRGKIAGRRAFLRTLVMVTFRPGMVARAVGGPVDGRAARKFRWIVTGLAVLAVLWLFPVVGTEYGLVPRAWRERIARQVMSEVGWKGMGWWSEVRLIWAAGAKNVWVALAGVAIAAGVACWWRGFAWGLRNLDEVRRERLGILGAYAVGPLAWLPVFALILVVRDGLAKGSDPKTRFEAWTLTALTALAIGAGALILGSAWFAPVRIRWRAADEGLGGAVISGIAGLPAGIVASMMLGLGVFPAVVGLILIAIGSLS